MIDQSVFVLMGINILMGWSFYVILLSGQFSFGNAGFMALGAYAAGVATVKFQVPFLVENLFINLDYTGAQVGFYGLQGTTLPIVYLLVALLGLLLLRVQHSRLARSLQAVRENEIVASTLGLNTTYLKLLSFSTGAAFASLAGALYAHYIYFISPELFGFFQSIWPAFYVAIGGPETVIGPILGAAVVTLLPEYFQPLKEWRVLGFGVFLLVNISLRPKGGFTPR